MRVAEILSEIIAWYRANVPDPTGWIEFRPGLTQEGLNKFQRKVGKPLQLSDSGVLDLIQQHLRLMQEMERNLEHPGGTKE